MPNVIPQTTSDEHSKSLKARRVVLIDPSDGGALGSESAPLAVVLSGFLVHSFDSVTTWPKAPTPVNLTASGQILSVPGQITGFYVNSTGGGTVRISDALTATTPYLGGLITPAVGYHPFPAELETGGYVTIVGTIDVTFFIIQNE